MGLREYFSKRDVKKSHEPNASKIKKDGSEAELRFCVQKHDASHLHYDFRLECEGVLISWAVPKGPSMNPQDKRLAIHVEDHPLQYQYFEGVIPKGHYGAGTVEIWDSGFYTVPDSTTSRSMEKKIKEGIKKGHFQINLKGEKLKGLFVFQKLNTDPEANSWLLIKKTDSYADSKKKILNEKISKKRKLPDFIAPMLCILVDEAFDDENWLFEIKWDGWRTLAFIDQGKVYLKSRTNHVWNDRFPSIVKELEQITGDVILDGEIVVIDSKGRSHFQLLQNYQDKGEGQLYYYVFDILYKDGKDLRELSLIERKEILKKYLADLSLPSVYYSDHISKQGIALFKSAVKNHLEGIVAKKITSTYQSKRGHDWLKIKTSLRQEVVIGGFTAPRGSRKKFGALLVGIYNEKKELMYTGHVGGGFNAALLKTVYEELQKNIQSKCPFKDKPKANAAVTWVKPRLICEVSFSEWTKENIMRQPIFQGLRKDKPAKKVHKEVPENVPKEVKEKPTKIGNLSLTHLDKMYWPKEKITKGDLIHYYQSIAPFILPYLKNRPMMLHRYPEGIEGTDFYQKDLLNHPVWVKTVPVPHEGKINNYLVINNLKTLLYAINLGSIDLHPFHATSEDLDHPDYCVIDIDPHGVPFKQVIEVAKLYHEILEAISVKHFLKTSGGNGLHIVIPLRKKYTYDQSRQFAEIISMYVHKRLPAFTSMERAPKKRPKKVYLDCLQNRSHQGIVAPYAVRPRPLAKVSTPLDWNELNDKLNPDDFTIRNTLTRLKSKGDLFKPILGAGVNLEIALKRLQKIVSI